MGSAMHAYLPSGLLLWLLTAYNSIETTVSSSWYRARTLYTNLSDALKEKRYILFEAIPAPYLASMVSPSVLSSAVPEWYYIPDRDCFVEWNVTSSVETVMKENARDLPILSMEIIDSHGVVYDLTEFIQATQVYSLTNHLFPCIAHILSAWSVYSGIVLNPTKGLLARIIDIHANTIELPINDFSFFEFEPLLTE